MLLLAKKVLFEYHALVLKMHQDDVNNIQVAHNLKLLCDLEVTMGFSCVMPMLERLDDLIILS
jgi:hypothetical protein